ncbi:MAG: CHAT domain-containing protein [Anaerolineales bacterium]
MKYLDFDLYVGQRGLNGYPLRAQSRLGQVPSSGQTAPLGALDVSDPALQAALADLGRGRSTQADLRALAQRLVAALLAGKIGDLLRTVRGAAAGQPDTGVRIRLRLDAAELAPLPWELLWLPDEADPLCVSGRGVVTRFLDMDAPVRELAAPRPLRVLGIIPQGSGLDTAGHKAGLEAAIAAAVPGPAGPGEAALELSWLEGIVTPDRIRGTLQKTQTHIVHFVGHGSLHDGQPRLHLNDNLGDDYPVSAASIAGLFRNRAGLRLVTLNACQGAAADSANALMGLAPQIAAQAVPAVVAMQWDIADWAAQKFAAVFYGALCAGPEAGEVDTALTRARAALYDDAPDSRAFVTPVLLLRAEGGRLWEETKMSDDEGEDEKLTPAERGKSHSDIQFGDGATVRGDVFTGGKTVVNTGGGAHYEGPIHTEGDFVGGNKTVTQTAGGDIVGRDKITTTTTTTGMDAAQLQLLLQEFSRIQRQVAARPDDPKVDKDILELTVKKVETEVKKGAAAEPSKVEGLLLTLGGMADDIFQVTANTLANPALGIATAIRLIAQKAKEEKKKHEGGG